MKPPAEAEVAERLRARIAEHGPIKVADYIAAANAHYYSNRESIGAQGDFITAPEVSQMFGELVGLWIADLWLRVGRPANVSYVELGPGRGTLARDALRAMAAAGLIPPAELVETSPSLRAKQKGLLPAARWHDDLSSLPGDGPLLVVANEFFDALPVHQYDTAGRELLVDWTEGGFSRQGEVDRESSPQSVFIVRDLSRRLVAQGGAALIVDYGHDRPSKGDTLQAVSRHAYADPWQSPGSRDLTAFVDFPALASAAREEGANVYGPVTQGEFLDAMGIQLRAIALAKAAPERTEEIAAARDRLIGVSQMGRLFKVMALAAPDWPAPVGLR